MATKKGKLKVSKPARVSGRKLANTDEIPRKQLLITLAGGALLVYASFKFINDTPTTPGSSDQGGQLASQMNQSAGFQPVGSLWRNPGMTMIERSFCVGSQRAAGCRGDRLHPFMEAFQAQGYTPEESEKFLGWDSYNLPVQRPIIDEQFVFENKGSRFLGKATQSE